MILNLLNLISFCDIQQEEGDLLCLGIQKSDSVNIIGREYLTDETFLDRIYHHKVLHSELSIMVPFINTAATINCVHRTDWDKLFWSLPCKNLYIIIYLNQNSTQLGADNEIKLS